MAVAGGELVIALRLDKDRLSREHWAVGRIHDPGETAHGYLLYLKSSLRTQPPVTETRGNSWCWTSRIDSTVHPRG